MTLHLTLAITLLYSVMLSSITAQTPFPRPTTLAAQIEALKTDSLVLRYKKLREEQVKDSEFPTYHFRAPENFIGDPNGFSYWQNKA